MEARGGAWTRGRVEARASSAAPGRAPLGRRQPPPPRAVEPPACACAAGSHLAGTRAAAYRAAVERSPSGALEDDALAMAQMEVPGCPAGGLYLFDFRILHRGMPNAAGRERAIAHAVLSTGWASDRLSFPDDSLLEIVEALPSDPARRRAKGDTIARQQRQAWAEVRASSAR